MADVVLFHHALGLTPGIVAFADELRRAGHTVHTPDLFEGRTFPPLTTECGTPRRSASATCRTLGELFLYPGDQHYFLDPTLPSYDAGAAALVMARTLTLLSSVE